MRSRWRRSRAKKGRARYVEGEDVDGVEVEAIATGREAPLAVLEEHVEESEVERAASQGLKLARGKHEGGEIGGGGGRKNVDAAMDRQ